MEVIIKKEFKDIHNGTLYNVGEKVDFSQERIKEINSVDRGLIKVVKKTKTKQ